MDDLIQEFLAETTESLNALDNDIMKLKQNPNDKDLIGRIFRLVHTVKGTCGFLGLARLEAVAHHAENIMGRYRDGARPVTAESVSLILEAFDRIKEIVASIAATEKEPEGDDSALIAQLDAVFDNDRKTLLLIFKVGEGAPRTAPLDFISRLEEFDVGKIETSGDQKVIQYRDKPMPLIPFSDQMKPKAKGKQPVLVLTDGDRTIGLMVDSIIDIVKGHIKVQISPRKNFDLLGSSIIHDQALDVIDLGHFLRSAHNDQTSAKKGGKPQKKSGPKKILLVDDSPFFRNMLSPVLTIAGHHVLSVKNAREAITLRNAGEEFDVIISDIEMPDMNGFEFAQKVKANNSKWKNIPLVALASHATTQDLHRGKAAGFNDYIAKFDREALLLSIARLEEAA